jgi:hypothetical protein
MPTRRTSPRRSATRPSSGIEPLYDDDDELGRPRRLAAATPFLAIAAAVIALAALGVAVFGRGSDTDSCRHAAWASVPATGDLPNGWTLSSTDLNANGMTVSINGPAPTDGSTNAPVVYASVTCYGNAAATAISDYRQSATAAGATITDRGLGGNAYDVDNPSTGSVTTLFRLGGLVGQIADAGSATPAELASITTAVASAMGDKSAAGTSAGGANPSSAAGSGAIPQPSGSDAAGPSASAAAAPELEALIPKSVGGATLTVQSAAASDVLGTDPNSRALSSVLRSLGAKASDLQFAQAYDETSTIDLSIVGFRLANGDGARLKTAIIDTWLSAGASGVKRSEVKLSGKSFTKIDYGDAGTIEYVYGGPDYVLVLDTANESIATEVASKLK